MNRDQGYLRMYYIFLFISFFSLSYVLFANRRIDCFTLLAGSLFYYSAPLLLGHITIPGFIYRLEIIDEIYIIYTLTYIALMLFMLYNDRIVSNVNFQFDIQVSRVKITPFFYLTLLIFLVGVIQIGPVNYFFENKSTTNINDGGGLITLSVWFSLILLVLTYRQKKYNVYFGISFLILASYLLFGPRALFVVGIMSLWLIHYSFIRTRLIYHLKSLIFLVGLAMLMVVYKTFYRVLKAMDLSLLVNTAQSIDLSLVTSALLGDPTAVIYNLQVTILNNVDLSISFLLHRIVSIFPALGGIYSEVMQEDFVRYSRYLADNYHNLHYGIASSIFGEFIAISGYLGLSLFITMWISIVYWFNCKILLSRNDIYIILFPAITYISFYIHRVDFTFALGAIKTALLAYIIIIALFILLKGFVKRKTAPHYIPPINL